jgi:oxygen-independent coproporphyrinogen-3 oxidase
LTLAALLAQGRFHAYAYAYPHKTAWRALSPAVSLEQAWSAEDRAALFLYVHVPFCEQRCGFCNLFTQVQPKQDAVAAYLDTLDRQARVTADALGGHRFAQLAIGGGTPTFLSASQLERLLGIVDRLGAGGVPGTVEASPDTLSDGKLALLAQFGVERLSVGVQSVVEAETGAVARRQDARIALDALSRAAPQIPVVNADLIYGLPGQNAASLGASIDAVLAAGANELYLYPLYVRPMTGLGRSEPAPVDDRLALYVAGRDCLLSLGWEQVTMRCFRRPRAAWTTRYRCQEDGMVGLGPGARSYTRSLHWSSPYANSQAAIRSRVAAWSAATDAELAVASHGVRLDGEEQRRRWVMLGLLESGLDAASYASRFGAHPAVDLPELGEVVDLGLGAWDGDVLRLNADGRAASDVLGQWLQSAQVAALRADYVPV